MLEPFMRIEEVPDNLDAMTDRVRFGGERIAIRKHGKIVAVLVPPSELEALEVLEDRLDQLDALEALADYRANGGVSIDDLKHDLVL